jgi:hypothetical protein
MVAGHKDEIDLGNAPHPFGADGLHPAQPGAHWQSLILFAVNFAGQTPDALCAIMEEIKFAHGFFLISSRVIRFKKPVSL